MRHLYPKQIVIYLFFCTLLIVVLGCQFQLNSASAQPSQSQDTPQSSLQSVEITEEPTSENMILPQPIEGAVGPLVYPDMINPLTGLIVTDPAILLRRPIIVKISNAPPLVRPQAGIGSADLVFEHYAEGGLTRFSAVFYGQTPTRVGSIRSARLIDYDLVSMLGGILVFSGASIGVEKVIYGWEATEARIEGSALVPPLVPLPPSEFAERAYMGVFYGAPYYWRDETIPVPHNMFASPQAIWDLASQDGFEQPVNLDGLAFHPDPPSNSIGTASLIDIRYRATRVQWTYDAEIGLYRRFADGQGHFDGNTLEQVTAANVIVLYADHFETDLVESQFNDSVSYSIQMTLQGTGNATLFREGQQYDGQWTRAGLFERFTFLTNEGDLLYLRPGNTWIQVVQLPEQQNPNEEWVIIE